MKGMKKKKKIQRFFVAACDKDGEAIEDSIFEFDIKEVKTQLWREIAGAYFDSRGESLSDTEMNTLGQIIESSFELEN
jgi:hypothetical protein